MRCRCFVQELVHRSKTVSWPLRWSAVAILCLSAAACGSGGPQLHPVSGQIFFEDQPADGARVVFHPVGGAADALRPSGIAGPDGSFALSCHKADDGAPEGNYVVAVVWYEKNTAIDSKNAELKNR